MYLICDKLASKVRDAEQIINQLDHYYNYLENPQQSNLVDSIRTSLHHVYDIKAMEYDDSTEILNLTKTAIKILHKRLRIVCADIEHQSKNLVIQEGIKYTNHMEE